MFIVNVEGAIRKNDKWLIIERSKKEEHAGGLLSLVGGKVDIEGGSSDILERTVKREIFEEVGVNVKDKINYVHCTSFITDKGKNASARFVWGEVLLFIRDFYDVPVKLQQRYYKRRSTYYWNKSQ